MTPVLMPALLLLLLCHIWVQVGCWVPATSCKLSVFDGVYCRMGASDSLLQVTSGECCLILS
jgi:hypothetical protein